MTKASLPVDIYVRVSRVGGRDELQSPDDQERDARTFAASRGLEVGDVIEDLDVSGGTLDRPGLQRILGRVEAGQSGGVVVAYLSRLTRDTGHGLALLDRVREAGGVVYAPNLPADYRTGDGRMLTTIQFAIDAGYRDRKSEEFERAKANAIEKGIPVSTRAPVGYRKREDRRLERDPATWPAVREVFVRRAGGAGPVALAELLEREGVTTSQGSATWSKPAIYGLIANRTYLGELRWRDYVNGGSHEPIVDVATWTAAQHPNGRNLATVGTGSAWLLTGLLRCAACRYCLQGTTTSRGKRIYRCTRRHAGGLCEAPARIDAERIELAVIDAFWSITADLEAEGGADHPDFSDLEAEHERAEGSLAQFLAPEVQEAIGDLGEYAAGLRERRAARDDAAAALGRARAIAPTATVDVPVETLRSAWERMDTRDRRELLSLRIDAIALSRDPVGIVVYPAGTGPADLPRRGFTTAPALEPFPDAPSGARVLAL